MSESALLDGEQKECEQCHHPKLLTEFHRRKNKTGDNRMRICAQCYGENLTATRLQREERMRQWKIEREQREQQEQRQREERKQQEQQRQALARELSLQANQRCPRCKQLRTDGHLWPNGRLYFPRFCETCINGTPHTVYKMTCPLLSVVRYIGITVRSLDKRLSQHVTGHGGTEYKQYWIDELRLRGLRPEIAPICEAPNEDAAKLEETRHIYHHIQQGHPLVNGEATAPQLVLYLQNSTTNWLEASEEDIRATRYFDGQTKIWSMNWGIYRKALWLHRNELVYLMQNGKPPYLWRNGGLHLDDMKAAYEKTYPTILGQDELPTALKERESILARATIVRLRAYTDVLETSLVEHDCAFLLARHIPVQVEDYTQTPSTSGILTAIEYPKPVDSPKPKAKRAKSPEGGKLIIHPTSYSVPSERAITFSVAASKPVHSVYG